MVDELWDCNQVAEHLGVNMNNLRQLQHRRTISWVKKEGKAVYYRADEIREYQKIRKARKTVK